MPNRLRRRAPWLCYRANQVQRSRDAEILRIMSLVCATARTSYRGADIRFIDKKGQQHQHLVLEKSRRKIDTVMGQSVTCDAYRDHTVTERVFVCVCMPVTPKKVNPFA